MHVIGSIDPGQGTLVMSLLILAGLAGGVATMGLRAGAADVQVALAEGWIGLPATLIAGKITFDVRNRGTMEHGLGLRIRGTRDPLATLETPLQPGASATREIDLQAGCYELYCPVSDHWARGESRRLMVVPANPDGR